MSSQAQQLQQLMTFFKTDERQVKLASKKQQPSAKSSPEASRVTQDDDDSDYVRF
jgi:methyl-accepting chemotaxis protein